MTSLEQRLMDVKYRPSGFDYMRLILSASVVCAHSTVTSEGPAAYEHMFLTPFGPIVRVILPMFFALSGFLVAGSLERTKSIVSFLGLRAIRIYPALGVEVLLSALILGPIFTTLPIAIYAGSPVFHAYFLNILGDIHFHLPGVFDTNPSSGLVNAQLWTVPYELVCYAVLAVLALLGVTKRKYLAPGAGALLAIVWWGQHLLRDKGFTLQSPLGGPLLVASFLFGVALFLYRDRIRWDWRLGFGSLIAAFVFAEIAIAPLLVPLPAAYATVYFGLLNPRKIFLIRGADYSYGIFLYGFVIQQSFVTLGPWTRHWYINILFCVPLSAAFAALSWNFVEKPALKLRTYVMAFEAWSIGFREKGVSR